MYFFKGSFSNFVIFCTGYVHHSVPIPSPPPEVLALSGNYTEQVYLVLFFDVKRTWQWLPPDKLEILGIDPERDQAKVISIVLSVVCFINDFFHR